MIACGSCFTVYSPMERGRRSSLKIIQITIASLLRKHSRRRREEFSLRVLTGFGNWEVSCKRYRYAHAGSKNACEFSKPVLQIEDFARDGRFPPAANLSQ